MLVWIYIQISKWVYGDRWGDGIIILVINVQGVIVDKRVIKGDIGRKGIIDDNNGMW